MGYCHEVYMDAVVYDGLLLGDVRITVEIY